MITCPGCKMNCEPSASECPSCGLVFRKWLAHNPGRSIPGLEAPAQDAAPARNGGVSAPGGAPVPVMFDTSGMKLGALVKITQDMGETGPRFKTGALSVVVTGTGIVLIVLGLAGLIRGGYATKVIGLFFIGMGAILVVITKRFSEPAAPGKPERVEIYENGIVRQAGAGSLALRWDELKAVYWHNIHPLKEGHSAYSGLLSLEGKDGVKIDLLYEETGLIYGRAMAGSGARFLEEARGQLSAGKSADFGGVSVSRGSIFYKLFYKNGRESQEEAAWNEVERLVFEARMLCLLKKDGKKIEVCEENLIANPEIFLRLLEEDLHVRVDFA
jgi:hypothetical protein